MHRILLLRKQRRGVKLVLNKLKVPPQPDFYSIAIEDGRHCGFVFEGQRSGNSIQITRMSSLRFSAGGLLYRSRLS